MRPAVLYNAGIAYHRPQFAEALGLACALLFVPQAVSQASGPHSFESARQVSFTITHRMVIQSGASDGSYNQAPAVVENSYGEYVLSYKKGVNHVNDPYVVLRHSQDKGATWGPETIRWNTSVPDPTLAKTPVAGDLLIEFAKHDQNGLTGAAYARSADGGNSWSDFTFFDDPVDRTYVTPTLYLIDKHKMYAAGYGPYDDTTDDAIIWASEDDGYSWLKLSTVRQPGDAGINETALAKVGSHALLAISRDDAGQRTWGHVSWDMGRTWSPQVDYTPQVGILQLPQLLRMEGVLLLFGRDPLTNELVMFVSYDNGGTFRQRTVLDTYTGLSIDGGYCWPIERGKDEIFVVYYADSAGLRLPDIKSLIITLSKARN